ncbi:hypothetical protein CPB83DRAFT_557032 [Crepidotus variabilis]|uniref:F-box domain-containing protein n=1 Tax=Crepidotus variabilis TaxID=179855 RepID=A0A9P6E9Z8_9AGAR|nr:hypothetical protein CPB83DRAFT_557032 [Crepidotus variabilis]
MVVCHYCRISSRPKSRIPDYILDKCHKNCMRTCFACQMLIDVDHKIEVARRALESLLDEREELTAILNEHHDPFVHRLPVEIASRVFLHCRPIVPAGYTSGACHDEAELIKGVFLPGRICRSWRHIAQGTPQLWTILPITISKSNCITSVSIVHDWLARSKGLPLLLELRCDEANYPLSNIFKCEVQKIVAAITHCPTLESTGFQPVFQLSASDIKRSIRYKSGMARSPQDWL